MSTKLGKELRRIREERDYSLKEVSSKVGISFQFLSFLEKGERKSTTFEIIHKIAKFYSIPFDYLTQFIEEDIDFKPIQLSIKELKRWNNISNETKDIFLKSKDTAKKVE